MSEYSSAEPLEEKKYPCWQKTKIVALVVIAIVLVIEFIVLLFTYIKLSNGICFKKLPSY